MKFFETGKYLGSRSAGPRVFPCRIYLRFHLLFSVFRQFLIVFEEPQASANDFTTVLVPAPRDLPPHETFEVLSKANARHGILLCHVTIDSI
jgi:hypothetical protein